MSELAARPIRALLIPLIVLTEGRLVPQVILDKDLLLARRPPARHQYSLPVVSPTKLSKAVRPKVDGEAVSHSEGEGVEPMVEAGEVVWMVRGLESRVNFCESDALAGFPQSAEKESARFGDKTF